VAVLLQRWRQCSPWLLWRLAEVSFCRPCTFSKAESIPQALFLGTKSPTRSWSIFSFFLKRRSWTWWLVNCGLFKLWLDNITLLLLLQIQCNFLLLSS
jgi:hypothetical protein